MQRCAADIKIILLWEYKIKRNAVCVFSGSLSGAIMPSDLIGKVQGTRIRTRDTRENRSPLQKGEKDESSYPG